MTEIPNVRKYLFDLAFDDEACEAMRERDKPKRTFTEEQVEAVKKESYDAGLLAGKNTAQASHQQQTNFLLAEIDKRLAGLTKTAHDEWRSQLAEIQGIALVIMRKIMPYYVTRHGLEEIEAIVSKTISDMSREPRLVIRVPKDKFDDASARIKVLTDKQAYAGKVVILGEEDLGPSDCRVEWADGGIERDVRALWKEIESVVGEIRDLTSELDQEDTAVQDAAPTSFAPPPPDARTDPALTAQEQPTPDSADPSGESKALPDALEENSDEGEKP